MPQMIVRHKVKDFNKWKVVFDVSDPIRHLYGEKNFKIFRNTEDPNEISILFEWDNPKRAIEYSLKKELREAMKKAGVVGDPVLYLLNEDLEK